MKRKHIKHLLLFINNTVMTQENGRIYNIHVHCERRKEKRKTLNISSSS